MRDWPGTGRTLVHAPDPLTPSMVSERLAAALAPAYRVLSVIPRAGVPYQLSAADFVSVLDQFGFAGACLLGEGLGCLTVMLVGAWHPSRAGSLILVDPMREPPPASDDLAARALRECPPDWPALRASLTCDVLELRADDPALVGRVEAFLAARLP